MPIDMRDIIGTGDDGLEVRAGATISVLDRPIHERLHYSQKLHGTLLNRLKARREMSEKHMKDQYDNWDRADEHLRCFIDLSRNARKADMSEDVTTAEMPFQYAIVVPFSYTMLWTRLVGLMSIFADRDPIIPIQGADPSDVEPAKMMEAMLAYDARQMVMDMVMFAFCNDAERYGIGAFMDEFRYERGWTYRPNPMSGTAMELIYELETGRKLQKVKMYGIKKEYNCWTPVDPFHFWPDPRRPMSKPQEMEFIGHSVSRSYLHLIKNSMPNGPYIKDNVGQLREQDSSVSDTRSNTESNRARSFNKTQDFIIASGDDNDKGYYLIDNMQVELIPREWKLSDSEDPQVWQFAWGNDSILIRGHETKYDHGEKTYSIGEVNHDPHALLNPGNVALMDGMQRMMNWMVNSHIDNVRRTVNNAALYSPTYVEENDILNPGPAGHIRFTEAGEELIMRGVPVSNFFKQATMMDVTGVHMQMANSIYDMGMKMMSVNEPAMGQVTESKRTLGELNRVMFNQERRIGLTARLLDSLGIRPAVARAIINRQQFTTMNRYYQMVGEEAARNPSPLLAGREHVLGDFDYVPNTGLIPPDPARFAQMWIDVMEVAGNIPQLFQPDAEGKILAIKKVFNDFARAAGMRNVEHYYEMAPMPVQVVPDEQVEAGVQAGNMVPAPAIMDPLAMARANAGGNGGV